MIKYKLLCDGFREAARNREMVAKKKNIIGYVEVEAYLKGASLSLPLPNWIPKGKLPVITKEDLHRALKGMHEEKEG